MKKLIFLLLLLPFTLLGQKEVIVHITTDAWPSETRWVLHADSLYGYILGDVQYGYYTQQNTSHTDTLYISTYCPAILSINSSLTASKKSISF